MGPSPRPTLRPTPQSDASIYLDGPWSHRAVSANGTRFHIAENGDGPLVLLLHGFPQFWWTWRKQLSTLASAGYRAVAVDLRGYGGSDKPPRGYDLITAASDAAGLIRSLGEANAVGVGHAFGFQLPMLPERQLLRHHAERVGELLTAWSGPGCPDPATEATYRAAMCLPAVAHSALA